MPELTDETLLRLAALEQAATTPPWATVPDVIEESVESTTLGRFVCHMNSNMLHFRDDAALIAEARNALPDLLSAITAGRERERQFREAVEKIEILVLQARAHSHSARRVSYLDHAYELARAALSDDAAIDAALADDAVSEVTR